MKCRAGRVIFTAYFFHDRCRRLLPRRYPRISTISRRKFHAFKNGYNIT